MKNNEQLLLLDNLLQEIQQEEEGNFTYDKEKIEQEVRKSASVFADLPVKLLTVFGGIMATLFFLSFLLLAGLYDSKTGMFIFGVLFIAGSVLINKLLNNTLAETASVTLHILGFILFSSGFPMENESALCVALILISLPVIFLAGSSIFVFLAVLVLNGSTIALIYLQQQHYLIHVYTGALAGLLTYLSLHEAKLITNPKVNELYRPVWMGLVLSLIGWVFMLTLRDIGSTGISHIWISSVLLFVALLLVIFSVMQAAGINNPLHQGLICLACCVMLAPTVFTPSLPGALLILLLSFYLGHKAGQVMGIVALVYFVIRFYYDLQLTLLAKSGLLVLTGVLFILGYLLLHKYLKSHAS